MYRINLSNSGQILKISQKCRYKLPQLKKEKDITLSQICEYINLSYKL